MAWVRSRRQFRCRSNQTYLMKIIEINVNGQIVRSFYKPYKTFRNAEKFGFNWAISQGFKAFKVEVFSV